MTSLRTMVVLVTVTAFFPGSAIPDDSSLVVAGTEIKLGMPKEPLLIHLQSRYKLTQASTDSYFILEGTGPNVHVVGGVAFKNDKVSWVSRNWGTFRGSSALGLGRELHSALANLERASNRPVVVSASTTQSAPGIRITQIEFLLGPRKLTLLIAEGEESKGGQQVSLEETLAQR